ncbi:hypothetical protein MZTS_15420 [Methylorubrum zatmanii]|nr:hypothetical protein [Methylorubrum zatmanii]
MPLVQGVQPKGRETVYQVVGFLAVGAAGAAMLHSWELPRPVSFGFLVLCSVAAAMAASSLIVIPASSRPTMAVPIRDMPPTEGRDAAKVCAADRLGDASAA